MRQKSWIDSFKEVSHIATQRVGKNKGQALHITGASCVGNSVVGIGKLVMGIMSMSFFTCASAFYTFGMVTAKCFAIAGIIKEENSKAQYRYYKFSGFILIFASVLYMLYSARLFYYPVNDTYHEYVAMGIATFTFTELTLNIRGVIVERNNHTPLVHAIKMINLASSLICLVLTQTAILSFASNRIDMHPSANGLIGILMGAAATSLGIIMIIRITQIQKGKNFGAAYRKVKKLMQEENMIVKMKPVRYIEKTEQSAELYICLIDANSQERFKLLKRKVNENLAMELIDISN